MGRMTYYAPLLIGFLFGAATANLAFPELDAASRWWFWTGVVLMGLQVGVVCQTAMIGAQGVWAQVLPVPGGRSIRGQIAVFSGTCLLASMVTGVASGLLLLEDMTTPALIVGVLHWALLLTAIGGYIWGWPLARRDFADVD